MSASIFGPLTLRVFGGDILFSSRFDNVRRQLYEGFEMRETASKTLTPGQRS